MRGDLYVTLTVQFFSMYVFCHLVAGLLLGLALYAWKGDRLLVPACVLGALLPDLVDKPLGLILTGTVGYGRIYFHTLFFTFVLLAAGAVMWRWSSRRDGFLVIAAALGVLSHQALDAMWLEPTNWLWPFLGPFPPPVMDIPLLSYILRDLLQPAEWLFAGASLFLAASLAGMRGSWQRLAPVISLILAFFAMWVFLCALTGSGCAITGYDDGWDNAIVAVILLAGAAGVDRVEVWSRR